MKRIMYYRLFAASLLLLIANVNQSTAQQNTEEQKIAAITNLALVNAVSRWCYDYQIDMDAAVRETASAVDFMAQPYYSRFLAARGDADQLVSAMGTETFCDAAYNKYGPRGLALMKRR